MKAVFDSNIVIDFLDGNPKANEVLSSSEYPIICIITWCEVLAGIKDEEKITEVKKFILDFFWIIQTDFDIAEMAVQIRKKRKLKLPDAMIYATAVVENCQLVTRNSKDFSIIDKRIIIPYTFQAS